MATMIRRAPWIAFLVPLCAYVYALSPGVGLWDTAEMQIEPWILGVPHPTGFPAFVLLGGFFAHAMPFGEPAWRIGVFSAVAMAGSCFMLALFLREFGVKAWAAQLGSLAYAFGDTTWTRGSRAEVQALAICCTSVALVCAVRWLRTGSLRDAVVGAASWGIGLATHPVTLFLAVGLAVVVVLGYRHLTVKRLASIVVAASLPVCLYAFIPLRSAYLYATRRDPTLSLGLPAGRPFWDTNHAAGGLASYLAAAPGQINGGIAGVFAPDRWGVEFATYQSSLVREFGIVAVLFGILGLALALRERPALWLACIVAVGLPIPFILSYPEADQDRYFLGSYWLFGALVVIGIDRGMRAYVRRPSLAAVTSAIALAGISISLASSNSAVVHQRDDRSGSQFAALVRASTPSNAIIVSEWTYVTPLAYEAYVGGDFEDRIVVSGWPTDYSPFYRRWLATRPLYVHVLNPTPPTFSPADGVVAAEFDPATYLYRIRSTGGVRPRAARGVERGVVATTAIERPISRERR